MGTGIKIRARPNGWEEQSFRCNGQEESGGGGVLELKWKRQDFKCQKERGQWRSSCMCMEGRECPLQKYLEELSRRLHRVARWAGSHAATTADSLGRFTVSSHPT